MDKGRELSAQERAREASLASLRLQHGGEEGPATLGKAIGTVTLSDLGHITQVPCARSSLLYGVASGTAIGGVKFLLTKRPATALNWAAAAFAGVSLMAFEACRFQRYQERSITRYAVDRVEIKRREKKGEGADDEAGG